MRSCAVASNSCFILLLRKRRPSATSTRRSPCWAHRAGKFEAAHMPRTARSSLHFNDHAARKCFLRRRCYQLDWPGRSPRRRAMNWSSRRRWTQRRYPFPNSELISQGAPLASSMHPRRWHRAVSPLNSAVVVDRRTVVGRYREAHLLEGARLPIWQRESGRFALVTIARTAGGRFPRRHRRRAQGGNERQLACRNEAGHPWRHNDQHCGQWDLRSHTAKGSKPLGLRVFALGTRQNARR